MHSLDTTIAGLLSGGITLSLRTHGEARVTAAQVVERPDDNAVYVTLNDGATGVLFGFDPEVERVRPERFVGKTVAEVRFERMLADVAGPDRGPAERLVA